MLDIEKKQEIKQTFVSLFVLVYNPVNFCIDSFPTGIDFYSIAQKETCENE